MKKKVAILGSTGHIAKGLIENLGDGYELFLVSGEMLRFDSMIWWGSYDAVINCTGPGDAGWDDPYRIFYVTEKIDNMLMDSLRSYPEMLYINLSSGAVYGDVFDAPVIDGSKAIFDPAAPNYYGIAKLNSEAKHRALDKFNIVDLRVFGYFSEHIRPDDRSIMGEILRCIREDREMVVSPRDVYRDYIHPKDLAQLVERCIEMQHLNTALDVYSQMQVTKFDLLDFCVRYYGLRYRIDKNLCETSPTGLKLNYYSNNLAAEDMGYRPEHQSMEAIADGMNALFSLSHEGERAGVRGHA